MTASGRGTHAAHAGQEAGAASRASRYTAAGRDGGPVLRPDPVRVQSACARCHAGAQRHRPADPGDVGLRRAMEAGAGRNAPGQSLSVAKRKQGFKVALRHPRRLRHPCDGREDLDGLRGPRPTTRSPIRLFKDLDARTPRGGQGRGCGGRSGCKPGRPALSAAWPVPLRARRRRSRARTSPSGVTYPIGLDVVT